MTEELFNSAIRVVLPTSSTSRNSPLTSLSNPTMDRKRRSPWSSPSPRLTLVGYIRRIRACWLMLGALLVKVLTNVVPRLELIESWTEDELTAVLHEASNDVGVVQKTFMTVLRHALSGMKVCRIMSRSSPGPLITLIDWTRGSGNHGCSRKRAECGPSAGSRDCILTTM